MSKKVIVVGSGMSGLTAALHLAKAGRQVEVLEGRDRIGGRMHTIFEPAAYYAQQPRGSEPPDSYPRPVELGAEFIHGAKNGLWKYLQEFGLEADEFPDRHWVWHPEPVEDPGFWSQIDEVNEDINLNQPDVAYQQYLDSRAGLDERQIAAALDYVRGFHAADPARVSVHSIQISAQAAEQDEATRQFRLRAGYKSLLEAFQHQLHTLRVPVRLNTVVKEIRWAPGKATLLTQTVEGSHEFQCTSVLITLPLGVLQDRFGVASLALSPALLEKEVAINGLAMGQVAKVGLSFRSALWPHHLSGFWHVRGGQFPTWWTTQASSHLTAWAGGPDAELFATNRADALESALGQLSSLYQRPVAALRADLVQSWYHDWANDPWSFGAYSYIPVGMTDMPAVLAKPAERTLYFAGEATDAEGEQGTVHGALASGERAAAEVLSHGG